MKKIEYICHDAGMYVAEIGKDAWVIYHPEEGDLPTESGMWDVHVENEENKTKYLGSVCTRKRAEKFILELIQKKETFETLTEVAYQYE